MSERCPSCGEPRVPGDEKKHATVERLVRPGQRYGTATAGQTVRVERRHAADPLVAAATWTAADARAAGAAADKAARAKRAASGSTRLLQMVEASLASSVASVQSTIARGRARRERDQRPADQERPRAPARPQLVPGESVAGA